MKPRIVATRDPAMPAARVTKRGPPGFSPRAAPGRLRASGGTMDLDREFPCRLFLSLDRRTDRRRKLLERLAAAQVTAEWFRSVPAARIGHDYCGFPNARKRACALSKRLALRVAMLRGAAAVLVLEDDLIFHPQFAARVAALTLPEDWGLFYFGCQHREPPEPVAPGLVRVRRALDNHAFAVRRSWQPVVRAQMRAGGRGQVGVKTSDQLLADLHPRIPTYAAFPNLIWQDFDWSDVALCHYSNYEPDGRQRLWRESVAGLESEKYADAS